LPGFFPVTIEAQAAGVQGGIVERIVPLTPRSINDCNVGIFPESSNGSR
jgi:hypothetical protein